MINIITASIFLNLIYAIIVFKFGNKLFILDIPNSTRKSHKVPVPLAGGTFILLNVLLLLFFFQFDYGNKILEFFYSRESIFSFFIGSISIFIIGLYDDKYNLKPNTKLFLLAFILMIVILLITS